MRFVVLLAAAVALSACGGSAGPVGPGAPDDRDRAAQTPEAAGAITGTLAGDAGLEGGCVWLDTPQGRFEVLWPDGYVAELQPLRLVGPDGQVVAEEGDRVTVDGAPADDVVSFCQVGRLWRGTRVQVVK